MAIRYVKSFVWLVTCSGTGYILLKIWENKEPALNKELSKLQQPLSERLKERERLISAIKTASDANSTPIYLMTQKQIKSDITK